MPIRLLLTLLVAVFAAAFTGFNLDNKCNVWLFRTFEMVPVAITIIISLLTGVVIMLPFTFGKRGKKKERAEETSLPAVREETAPAKKGKKRGFLGRGDKNAASVADAVPEPSAEPAADAAAEETSVPASGNTAD